MIYIYMYIKDGFFGKIIRQFTWYRTRQTDRQTDILLKEKKSHHRFICHRNERDICTCIYKIVSLLKSYDNIHGMTYTTKIMLSGIAKIKTGYFDNIKDYY